MVSTDTSLPIWLKQELVVPRERGALVVHAVAMLTASAQLAANGQLVKPSSSNPRVPEWLDGLQSRLCGLPRRTGVHASDVALSHRHLAAAIACRLLEAGPHIQTVSGAPLKPSDVGALLHSLAVALERVEKSSRAANRRPPKIVMDASPRRTPHTLMQATYVVLGSNKLRSQPVQSDIDALILFGLAASALMNMRGCEFCFRLAMPGHQRCSEHSLSKEAGGDRLLRQSRYQAGRRAVSEYQSRLRELPTHFNFIASLKQRSLLIASVLWGGSIPDERRIAASISKLIERYPHVKQVLEREGGTLPTQLFERLRRVLDPLEFIVGNWRAKLRAAEAWFSAVESSTPGARRSGAEARYTKSLALDLVKGVPLSKSQLATALGIHPSTLSKWFDRNGDDPVVAEIASRMEASAGRVRERKERKRRLLAKVGADLRRSLAAGAVLPDQRARRRSRGAG